MEDSERYAAIIAALASAGHHAECHRPGQLVLSGRLWITWQAKWFVSTWLPAIYPVPLDVDIVALCVAIQEWPSGPFYTIPDEIADRFGLARADYADLPEWFAEG
jgi:hypothetical protein